MSHLDLGTLLVVEDDVEVLEVIKDVLDHSGIAVLTASDGVKGFEVAEKMRPTAILTDVNMPGMNGIEMLEKLREKQILIPVVILSGYMNRDFNLRAIRAGVFDVVHKPFKLINLVQVVREALEQGQVLNEFEAHWIQFLKENPDFTKLPEELRLAKRKQMKIRFLTSKKVA